MTSTFLRCSRFLALPVSVVVALSVLLASLASAQTTPSTATSPSGGPIALSRQTLAVTGGLAAGASTNYTVSYQPQLEGSGNPAPWLLRMFFAAPGATPNSIGFNWTDQTNPTATGTTAGNTGKSVAPSIGGNLTDVPSGTDTGTIQQAVLSGASSGAFAITVTNSSTVAANYTLQLFPLLGGVLESGISANPTPISAQGGAPAPAPPAAPAPPTTAPAPAPQPAPSASPGGPITLSRDTLAVTGSLKAGASASYTVNYQPQLEGSGNPAPWLLRMFYSAPGASPNTIGFSWLDQTNPTAVGTTNGNNGKSAAPSIGGNATDVPLGTDTGTIQQAVLSGASPGTFAITVTNSSNVVTNYTLQLFPLLGGVLEPGLNPNPTPVKV